MSTITQIIDTLQNLTGAKINQSDIARALDITRATVSARVKSNSSLNFDEIKKIGNYYNVNLLMNIPIKQMTNNIATINNDSVTLDYFPDVFGSCGNGVFELSKGKEQITVPMNALFKQLTKGKQYSVINARGNSMEPLIFDKDKLIIEHWNGEQIIDNRPYIFCYKDEIFIKRLAKNINQLVIMPENKDYDTIKLTGSELQDVNIIGQVVGLMRDLR